MLRRSTVAVMLSVIVLAAGCDLLNPERPTVHGDTTLFGNLLEVDSPEGDDEAWWVKVRLGVPRALAKAEVAEGKPTPTLEEGLVADVRVTAETVVLVDGAPAFVEDIAPGSEVVVEPLPGSTRMVGTSNMTVEAAYLTDFATYRRWQLPGLATAEDEADIVEDPARINSAGVEHAPIPIGDGSVLYFSARLRSPAMSGDRWLGARREGLSEPSTDQPAAERSYRTELTPSGWGPPVLVRFEGLGNVAAARVSWVSPDETASLVTVETTDGESWVGRAERSAAGDPWGPVVRIEELGEGNAYDGVYLAGSRSKIVFTANWSGNPQSDLVLYDPAVAETPQLLTPPINSAGSEWGARVGPGNELFFVRGDRQLALIEGSLQQVRLPTPHRAVLTEAVPTADASWVFLCRPEYRPVEADLNIWVARWAGGGRLGEPVPVDDWRP